MARPLPLRVRRALPALAATALVSCSSDSTPGPRYAESFVVVTVPPSLSAPTRLAVEACAGLHNRKLGGSVYVHHGDNDADWLTLLALTPSATVTADEFLTSCVATFPRCVRYDYTSQQTLLPNVLTAAAALSAVPVDDSMSLACDDPAFDAIAEFPTDTTPAQATQRVFDLYGDRTTGLAMLNPGYDITAPDRSNPPITRDMPTYLVDYVFSHRLFVAFLVNGCDNISDESYVLQQMVSSGVWPTPVGVYGYNNSWLIGGYIFEAQTRCLDSRNMGAIPTEAHNLSFFSTRRAPIEDPSELEPPVPETVTYDPTKTYVAFVIGDGDNVQYIMDSRKHWLKERLDTCADPNNVCAPLTWSISPHLPELAPDVLQWYFASSRTTGKDTFILPPSGFQYAYPTSLNAADQDRFVANTERVARLYGLDSTVHWDVNSTWRDAESTFLPKYAHAGGAIHGIVPVNVPYFSEPFSWWDPSEYYRVLPGQDGSRLVVFQQREWRGVDDGDPVFRPSPQTMANELTSYPPGTVTAIYMTSDGGLTLSNSFVELVNILPTNVQVVSVDTAVQLALDASAP